MLVAVADEREQAVGAELVYGQVAQFIDAQYLGFDVVVQHALDAATGLRSDRCVDDVDGAGEQYRVASQAGRVTQRRHQMALAQSGARDEHDVGVLLDEVQVKQVLDEQSVDLGGPVPVELIKRLEHRESCQVDAALHAPVVARGGLAAE